MQHALWPSLGHTRTTARRNYTLLTPDSFVRAPLPGMKLATAIVHAAPAVGARFTQYSAEMERGGELGDAAGERFVYVVAGEVSLELDGRATKLGVGGFAFLPEDTNHKLTAKSAAHLAVIEKPYVALAGVGKPKVIVGKESQAKPQPLLGDKAIEVRGLIPADPAFDLAVNTMTYAPGAALPMVESHVMEHGLLMLDGGGIYRLDDDWHPTVAGDFIWMGPYCPQWFGALGKTPARYLIYKDWNR